MACRERVVEWRIPREMRKGVIDSNGKKKKKKKTWALLP